MVHGFDWGVKKTPFFRVFEKPKMSPPGGEKSAPPGGPFSDPPKGVQKDPQKDPQMTPFSTPFSPRSMPYRYPSDTYRYRRDRRERGIQRIFTSVAIATSFRHNVSSTMQHH